MATKNDEFLKRLLATFKIEADEHLQAMSAGLLELEELPSDAARAAIVERVFREAHSLKGAARAVNLSQVEQVCQALESVFAALKANKLAVSQPLLDLLQEALADLGTLLSSDGAAMAVAEKSAIEMLVQRLREALSAPPPAHVWPVPEMAENRQAPIVSPLVAASAAAVGEAPVLHTSRLPPQPANMSDSVRVSMAKLATVMRQAEELLPAKLAHGQRLAELREIGGMLAQRKKQCAAIGPQLRALETAQRKNLKKNGGSQPELAGLLEYLAADCLHFKALEARIVAMARSAEHDGRALDVMVDGLLQDMREMLMLPFSTLLESFPLFVRELARDQGKEIELALRGGKLEIDRRILEEIKDPLIHLLRNSADHGIETPEVRREKQKAAAGSITIGVTQRDGDKVEIVVADDGAGIAIEKVKAAALRLGLLAPEEADNLGEKEALALVFHSGVSTSHIITDLSGRGLGLAIVREKIERLGGTISVEAQPGKGTLFRMVLPLTLAIFRGVLVRVGEQYFVLPLHSVEGVLRVSAKEVRTVENRETISFGGQAVALARLGEVLELDNGGAREAAGDNIQAAILVLGNTRIAFQVDEVLGEQEVLVKMLGRQLARVRNVAGACALGTGQIVPVLNVSDLLLLAMRPAAVRRAPVAAKPAAERQRSVLVAEDSITSRSLLKNILESAGYRVVTAVDGLDAYTTLKTAKFDLLVSDVDMPRMSGFDLTAKVRADKQLAELPVVLVTALGSREHRERGIDVGANAYIVKSSFDQSNLLEVLRQLI